jgi:aryl sulfotransferase
MGPGLSDVLHHLQTFWDRREERNVALFHYSDMLAGLPVELRRLSNTLGIEITDERLGVRRRGYLRGDEGSRR